MTERTPPTHRVAVPLLALAIALIACLACAGFAEAKPKQAKGTTVDVMTRNLYLGADLGPALSAKTQAEFFEANGAIYRQVEATNFPVRARGLAQEILSREPDLVGLQEVALWREGPPSVDPVRTGKPAATTVKYDFLKLLLGQLNRKGNNYRAVVVQNEFDFEAPANANGLPGDGLPGSILLANTEINGRLTMRDVILAKVGGGVVTSNPRGGNFVNPLVVDVAGTKVPVTRGWTAVDAKVRGSKKLRFVNSHLEAFDPESVHPSIRALQAGELVAPGGPANSKLPVVLLGDFNSDVKTEVKPGDSQAYRVLKMAGFRERGASKPLSCCISSSYDLKSGGSRAEFNHQVDHVMTDTPNKIKLISSSVTGLSKAKSGYWDSDHAGIFSSLLIQR